MNKSTRSRAGRIGAFSDLDTDWPFPPVFSRFDLCLGKMLDTQKFTGDFSAPYLRNIDVQWDRINVHDLPLMDFDESERERLALKFGDLLICEGGEPGRTAIWQDDHEECYFQKALHRLRPNSELVDSRYFFWIMRYAVSRGHFEAHGNSSTIKHLPGESLRRFRFPCPPVTTQRRIATYLDRETSEIDRLIAAKERLLTLLTEKRQAFTTHAVANGLQKNVKLIDSGNKWLGEIPVHWRFARLKFLATVGTGLTIGKDYGTKELLEFYYLRVANVQDGYLKLDEVTKVSVSDSDARNCLLKYGDVLMNEGGDIDKLGRGCVWREEVTPCLHQNHVFSVRPHSISSEWLALWTSTNLAKKYFENHAKRTTNLASISSSNLRELPVPIPPESEQLEILDFLQRADNRMIKIVDKAQQSLSLLHERRSTLIAAAVTGELEVP